MRRRLPPSHWLRAFEASARYLSFTGAAKELNITQSAVSQQVKLLEHYLRAPLFHRSPRSLQLSDAGKAYLPLVQEAFERLAAGTEELFGHAMEGLLTVKVNASFAALWLAPRLGRFRALHPEIEMRFTHSVWPTDHDLDDVDLEIRYGAGHWPGLRTEQLTWETRFPVCAPSLLQANATLRSASELARHTLIHVIGNEVDWPRWLKAANVKGVDARRGLQLEASFVAFELAAAGVGVALAHSSLADNLIRAGRLVSPFGPRVATNECFYLVSADRLAESPAAAAFRSWLLAEAKAWADEPKA